MKGNPDVGFSGGFSVLNKLGGTGIDANGYVAVFPTQQVAPVPGSAQPIKTIWGPTRGFAWGGFVNGPTNDNSLTRFVKGAPFNTTQGEGYPIPTEADFQEDVISDPPLTSGISGTPVLQGVNTIPILSIAVIALILWGLA